MMNFALAREIYGTNPFLVDSSTLPAMMSVLNDFRNGVKYNLENKELKNSSFQIAALNETRVISKPWQLNTDDQFDGVGVVNINGPILVNSGRSTLGMKEVSETMLQMSKDSRIKSFIILFDSGGGSSAAVEIMDDCIKEIQSKGKKVYSLITKGGILASAAYGIASSTDKIYFESDMSMVGSLGTMIQFSGVPANKEVDGVKYIRLYATKSTMKNKEFEDAINDDNYEMIVNDVLDPTNERFLKLLKSNRPSLSDDLLNGSIKYSKDSISTLTDGKMSFRQLLGALMQPNSTNSKMSINQNQLDMTKAEFQQSHPDLYQEIYNEGVTTENERVQSWLAHVETDQEAVLLGIESGKEITPSGREKLLVKQNKLDKLAQSENDNAKEFTTQESSMGGKEDERKKEIEKAFALNLKKQ